MKDALVRATIEKWATDRERAKEIEKELNWLYTEGTLKVRLFIASHPITVSSLLPILDA